MKNIVWQRPDGGISITVLTPEALEKVAVALSYETLVPQRATLTAEVTSRKAQLALLNGTIKTKQLEAQNTLASLQTEADTLVAGLPEGVTKEETLAALEPLQGRAKEVVVTLRAAVDSLQAQAYAAVEVIQAAQVMLEKVAYYDLIKETIGLDSHEHELVLQGRGDVPVDHLCVGHDQDTPTDRTFRNGWAWVGDKVGHDMEKCREIWREKMRIARKPKLEALDVAFTQALEVDDKTEQSTVVAQKTALRDVTDLPEIEAAMTPDELKAIWPEELK